jgi:cytosine/adenosine deaminase-related metal-dependent hydrolase
MTGFVNAHTHVYGALAPLAARPLDPAPRGFLDILRRVWWTLDRAIDEASLRASARLYVAGALEHGTLALIDHHESPGFIEGSLDILAEACDALGMPAVLCYGATERNGGREEARRGLAECRRFARANTRPGVRAAVGLHASFTVSDATIAEAARLCRELGAVLHVHVAEDESDVADARARGYAGPLERLDALGALVPGSILAHGVHLSPDQVRRAGDRGCWLVQNPRSNRHNLVGYAAALRYGARVALGTDGFVSDMPEELAFLQSLAPETGENAGVLQARLDAGRALAAELFGRRLEHAAPPPSAAVMDGIRRDAAVQAERLSERMAALADRP